MKWEILFCVSDRVKVVKRSLHLDSPFCFHYSGCMKKALVWLSIIVVVVVGGKYFLEYMDVRAYEHSATTRVQTFLDGMKPGGDFQEAFNMWLMGGQTGIGTISQEQYNAYVNQIVAWMAERGLGRGIQSYEITDATLVRGREGLEPAVVDVSCTIDGVDAVIHAVEREPLTWAN